jgi:hypothetical protein
MANFLSDILFDYQTKRLHAPVYTVGLEFYFLLKIYLIKSFCMGVKLKTHLEANKAKNINI